MIDKNFCMNSYLAFRYIERDDMDFYERLHHGNIKPASDKIKITTADAAAPAVSSELLAEYGSQSDS